MLAQAAGFALLAAISPTALLVMAVFLGSAKPREAALAYVAGAMVMTVAMAVALLLVIRETGLNLQRNHDPRYGLRLGLGVLALAAAIVVIRRRPRVPASSLAASSPAESSGGFVSRLAGRSSARSAFVVGIILFAPSATFIAAVQVIATAGASVPGTVIGLVIVVIVSVLIVWVPLLAFLAAPEATTRRLGEVNGWLRTHSKRIAAGALGVGGVILIGNGVLGLIGVI